MPTPLEYMAVRAPEFAADDAVLEYISFAEEETGNNYLSVNSRNKAVFLKAAHNMALNARNSNGSGIAVAGAIKSEKEGDLSRSYDSSGVKAENIDPFLAQTSWGVELHNLQRSSFFLPRTRF